MQGRSLTRYETSVETALAGWLHEKSGLSGSSHTERAYREAIVGFRFYLLGKGLDLDSAPGSVGLGAQAYCGRDGVSPSTFNKRRDILSSFYTYCIRNRLLGIEANPLQQVLRRKTQAYRDARALGAEEVMSGLKGIDRTTLEGKRDYALLTIALVTGRRVSELAGLRLCDIESGPGGTLLLSFRRTKGGKSMRDTLPPRPSLAVSDYLKSLLGEVPLMSESPIWLSLSSNHSRFRPLRPQALERICSRRLGTTRFHRLRHSFAHAMEEAGAKVSDIQSRLGHTNIATTGRYLASLRSDENPHGEAVARMFGLGE